MSNGFSLCSVAVWYLMSINLWHTRTYYRIVRCSFLIDVEAFYSFFTSWVKLFFFKNLPILQISYQVYFYFKFDVEYFSFWIWCRGFIFQRFLHDVRLKALSLVSLIIALVRTERFCWWIFILPCYGHLYYKRSKLFFNWYYW